MTFPHKRGKTIRVEQRPSLTPDLDRLAKPFDEPLAYRTHLPASPASSEAPHVSDAPLPRGPGEHLTRVGERGFRRIAREHASHFDDALIIAQKAELGFRQPVQR